MLLVSTPQVTPSYFVCYLAGHSNFWMHYDERYHGGCHRASFYLANKKAGLLDLYRITHVTVVVDPIPAKSCRSLGSLFCGRGVIALPVDQQQREGPRVTALALALAWPSLSKALRTNSSGNLVSQPSALQRLLDSSSCRKPPHISIKSFTRRPLQLFSPN